MNRTRNVVRGIFSGIINNLLSIGLPFISRTILIRQLGTEYVGLGSLFTSILQVLSLSELGFGTAIGYLLYKPMAERDNDRVNAILNFYRKTYRIVGIVILMISIGLLPFLDKLIAGDIPNDINLYVLYGIYVFNTVASYFFFAYRKVLLSSSQRYDVEVGIASLVLGLQYIIQIIMLFMFKNYYLYIIILPIMTVVGNLAIYIVTHKMFPEYTCSGKLKYEEIKIVLKNTGGAFFSKIGSTVYLSVDNIVISAFLGLKILGDYNNYYYVISALIMIFAVIHNSIRPVIGNMIVTEGKEKIWNSFRMTNYLYMLLVIVCCSCCYILYQDFIGIWCGENNLLGFGIVFLLVVYFFVGRMSAVLVVYQEASGLLWQGKFIPLISSVINLFFNIVLVKNIGLTGVLISTIISSVFVNFPGYVHIMFKNLFQNKKEKILFLRDFLSLGIQAIVLIFICSWCMDKMKVETWVMLFVKGILTFLLSGIMILIMNFRNSNVKSIIQKVCRVKLGRCHGKSK